MGPLHSEPVHTVFTQNREGRVEPQERLENFFLHSEPVQTFSMALTVWAQHRCGTSVKCRTSRLVKRYRQLQWLSEDELCKLQPSKQA